MRDIFRDVLPKWGCELSEFGAEAERLAEELHRLTLNTGQMTGSMVRLGRDSSTRWPRP